MNREGRKRVFENTFDICNSIYKDNVKDSINRGMVYKDAVHADKSHDVNSVSVTKNTSFDEAFLYAGGNTRVGVLNFASGTNPGGGVTKGSSAQEECLCRESTLYPVISDNKFSKDFYQYHRGRDDSLYSDRVIYTPDIIVFKDTKGVERETPFKVDVFTCCAPNLRLKVGKVESVGDKDLLEMLIIRYTNLLNIVELNNIDVFVTGAIGCGVFQNKPFIVATSWEKALRQSSFSGECVFAVYCKPDEMDNYNTFSRVLKSFK